MLWGAMRALPLLVGARKPFSCRVSTRTTLGGGLTALPCPLAGGEWDWLPPPTAPLPPPPCSRPLCIVYVASIATSISPYSTYTICCGFVVQQTVQEIHSKSKVHSKSTTSWHVKMLWICCGLYRKSTTSTQQMELVEFMDLWWRCSQSRDDYIIYVYS